MEFRVADHAATGLPDGVADAVVSIDALPSAADRDAAHAEVHRMLRPGGRLVFTCTQRRPPTVPTWPDRLDAAVLSAPGLLRRRIAARAPVRLTPKEQPHLLHIRCGDNGPLMVARR